MKYAILEKDNTLRLTNDPDEWACWFERSKNRFIKRETINGKSVSTVCLGLDHSFGDGKPLWFETMIFGGDDSYQERCETYEEALKMHAAAVKYAKGK